MVGVAAGLVRDRLAEFQRLAVVKGSLPLCTAVASADSRRSDVAGHDRSTGRTHLLQTSQPVPKQTQPSFMRSFFEDVDRIQDEMKASRGGLEAIGQIIEDALQATTREKQQIVSDQLAKLVGEVQQQVSQSKRGIELLQGKATKQDSTSGAAEQCIKANMHLTLVRKHQQLLLDFQRVQLEAKHLLQRQQVRELGIVCPEACDQELQQMVEEGGNSAGLILQRMAGAHAAVLDEVQGLREKQRDILRLEHSIQDLVQMFNEMALLVDDQGAMLDNIELHVQKTHGSTTKAVKELQLTKKTQDNTRRWTSCLAIILFVLLFVVLFPVLVH